MRRPRSPPYRQPLLEPSAGPLLLQATSQSEPDLFEPGGTPSLPLPFSLTPLLGLGHPTCPFQDSDSDTEGGASGGAAESKCLPGGGLGGGLGLGL